GHPRSVSGACRGRSIRPAGGRAVSLRFNLAVTSGEMHQIVRPSCRRVTGNPLNPHVLWITVWTSSLTKPGKGAVAGAGLAWRFFNQLAIKLKKHRVTRHF